MRRRFGRLFGFRQGRRMFAARRGPGALRVFGQLAKFHVAHLAGGFALAVAAKCGISGAALRQRVAKERQRCQQNDQDDAGYTRCPSICGPWHVRRMPAAPAGPIWRNGWELAGTWS